MIKLTSHFEDKNTYIMGNFCLNGCQLFHKNDAQKIFDDFNVSLNHQDDVINSFYNELTKDDKLPSKNLNVIKLQIANGIIFDEYIHHPNWIIRTLIVKYGTDEMRQQLIKDLNWHVRLAVSIFGTNEMRQQLIKDPDYDVKRAIVIHGTDEMRQQLINDPDCRVRSMIAIYGTDEMRQQLINDPDILVWNIVSIIRNTNN